MTSRARPGKLVPAVLAVARGISAGARAGPCPVWFGGFGGGFGLGMGFRDVPARAEARDLPQPKSLVDAARADADSRRETSTPTTPTPTSTTSGITVSSIATAPTAGRSPVPVPSAAAVLAERDATPAGTPSPLAALSSFYNAENMLVWPGDAPTEGELKEKRAVFDKASEVVLAETKKTGSPRWPRSPTRGRNCSITAGRHLRTPCARHAADRRHVPHVSCCRSTSRWPRQPTRRRPPPAHRSRQSLSRASRRGRVGCEIADDQGPTARATTVSRFFRDRSRWMTLPSRPIRTLVGISATP